MIDDNLLNYIRRELTKGVSAELVKNALLENGWDKSDIDGAFLIIQKNNSNRSNNDSGEKLDKLPDVFEIIKDAFLIYKSRFFALIFLQALAIAVSIIYDIVPKSENIIITVFVWVVMIVFLGWFNGALFYTIIEWKNKLSVISALKKSFKKILSFWWLVLLYGVAVALGTMLFVIPGILSFVWFGLVMFVLFAEDIKGIEAMRKSKYYVEGYFWGVFFRVIFILALAFFTGFVSGFITALIPGEIGVYKNLVIDVILILTAPLWGTTYFIIYKSLKILKKGVVFEKNKLSKTKVAAISFFVLLIPFIMAVVFTSLGVAREKARDVKRNFDLSEVQTSLSSYYLQNGRYPSSLSELKSLKEVPVDPKTKEEYDYQFLSSNSFKFCIELESKEEKCITEKSLKAGK